MSSQRRRAAGERFVPDRGRTLDALLAHDDDVRAAEYELQLAVSCAKSAGLSWSQIGETLGMSRQAAHKRFGRSGNHLAAAEFASASSSEIDWSRNAEAERKDREIGVARVTKRYEVRRADGQVVSRHRLRARAVERRDREVRRHPQRLFMVVEVDRIVN